MARIPGRPSTNPQTGVTSNFVVMTRNPTGSGDSAAWGEVALTDAAFVAAMKSALGLGTATVPTNTAVPRITGTAQVGQTLTRTNGVWAGSNISFTYAWLADGVPISGATGQSYIVTSNDLGKSITARETATVTGAGSTIATSAPTSAVIAAFTAPAAPSLTVTPGDGKNIITWVDGATGGTAITAHKLYRGTVSGSRTLIGTIGTAPPYEDSGLTNGTTYYYSLTAVNGSNSPESAQSTEVSATPAVTIVNLANAAPRVAVSDASYWIRTSGTLARTTDTNYESNLKANTGIPFPSQTVPAGSIGYVSIKHAAVTAGVSPPLFVNWDGNAAQPSVANPVVPTIWYSSDSTDGSPDTGTWTQDTSFTAYRPIANDAYVARGQRYFWPTAGARWVQVRFDATGLTQAFIPHVIPSSGQWLWVVGMSIIRNMHTNISSYASSRNAIIAANPGSDPFMFVTARSGANQTAIKSEQVDVVLASATLKSFIRGVYADTWVNDIAYVSQNVRPYSVAAGNGEAAGIRTRSDGLLTALKTLNTVVVAPDCSFLNFTAADATANSNPYVNGGISGTTDAQAFQSPNGAFPYNQNVFGPAIKANLPSSWDFTYDMPYVSDYAGLAEKFETDTPYAAGDSVHPNGAGYINWRTRRAPLDKLLYGGVPAPNTLQSRVAALGSSTTAALKTRLQTVFDAVYAMYPTTNQTALNNRANLRALLDGISVP